MTLTGEDPNPEQALDAGTADSARDPSGSVVHQVCPFLVAGDGSWRTVVPAREQRCGATMPASPLAVGKQRDLCTRDAHRGCATFVAARELQAASTIRPASAVGGLWPDTLGGILAVEPARGVVSAVPGSVRAGGQALLIGLMVLAFLILVIARTAPPSAQGDPTHTDAGGAAAPASVAPSVTAVESGPSGVPSPAASVEPSAEPSTVPSTTPTSSSGAASPTVSPTTRPTARASEPAVTRYVVKSGDTLSSIAAKFNTTVRKLKAANAIADASVIRVGQALVIP